VIILTSNIGSHHIMAMDDPREMKDAVMGDLRAAFRPEFLNRIDDIVVFQRLERSDLRRIVDIQLDRFARRLATKELSLEVTDGAKEFLANVGYDPTYGARPLKRAVQQYLENPLAQELLAGAFLPGDTVYVTTGEAGELAFERRPPADDGASGVRAPDRLEA